MDKRGIDFVIPWVDGRDPDWRRRKAAVLGTELEDDQEERYRSWDLLRFWFRGIEKFTPWATVKSSRLSGMKTISPKNTSPPSAAIPLS